MKLQTVNLAIYILIFVILTACSPHPSATPPPSTQKTLLYPDAQQLQTQTVDDSKPTPTKVTTFRTISDPNRVLQFYKDTLLKEGWRVLDQQAPSELRFYWTAGCPNYGMYIVTKSENDGQTGVEIKLVTDQCI